VRAGIFEVGDPVIIRDMKAFRWGEGATVIQTYIPKKKHRDIKYTVQFYDNAIETFVPSQLELSPFHKELK